MRGAATGAARAAEPDAVEQTADAGPGEPPAGGWRATRRAEALRAKKSAKGELETSGFPTWQGLKPVLLFLIFPAAFAFAIVITGGQWEPEVLYPLAGLMGLYVLWSVLRGAELVIACTLLYLPFSGDYVIPIAPGVNGTNMLLLLGIFAAVLRASDSRQGTVAWPIGTSLVFAFGALTTLSGFTLLQQPGGWSYLLHNEILSYKGWIDQFLFYAILASCIRDVETAKRIMVYMAIGAMVLVVYAVPEMLAKAGRSTIEKSRIEGPHQQSNNFGGFVAYTLMPLVAWFMVNIRYPRTWLLAPFFLLAAKVLVSTFSRGAYVAVALSGMLAGLLKGKGFLAFWAMLGMCFFLVFPRFIPDSIMVRLESITTAAPNSYQEAELDKSSANRLILWGAAIDMMKEDPLTGKGFKAFQKLKEEYTETPVRESDPHSMYMYIGSQMGVPALILYFVLLGWAFWMGRRLSRIGRDRFVRAIGIGGASATACLSVICLFGSRAVNLEFTAYWWAMLVVLQVVYQHERDALRDMRVARGRRTAKDVAREIGDAVVPPSAGVAFGAAAANDPAAPAGPERPARKVSRKGGRKAGVEIGRRAAREADRKSARESDRIAAGGAKKTSGTRATGRRKLRGAKPPIPGDAL